MKSKITGISPEGATVARANGEAVNVGDEVEDAYALTLTIPNGSTGGSVQFEGAAPRGVVAERVGVGVLFSAPTEAPTPIAIPALAVSDTANPIRVFDRIGGIGARVLPPVLKIE